MTKLSYAQMELKVAEMEKKLEELKKDVPLYFKSKKSKSGNDMLVCYKATEEVLPALEGNRTSIRLVLKEQTGQDGSKYYTAFLSSFDGNKNYKNK